MFSGIVEHAGEVIRLEKIDSGARLTMDAASVAEGIKLGDSVAHNGCCLTVSTIDGDHLAYDLLEETLRATNLGELQPGHLVNLERSLLVGDRIGGHFVTGHVDGTATVTKWQKQDGGDYTLEVEVPESCERYLVPKGCVALDGMSLTVGQVDGRRFNVWIIPHTYEVTSLKDRQVGDRLNIEFDMLAKYTEKLLGQVPETDH
ncbi:MAG: riboflavin synthase [Verrucomicrobiota bacterium]